MVEKNLYLNNSSAASTYNFWNNTSPTNTVFSVSSDTNVNSSSGNYVFYAFHSVSGYQKIGSYSGTGSSLEITVRRKGVKKSLIFNITREIIKILV